MRWRLSGCDNVPLLATIGLQVVRGISVVFAATASRAGPYRIANGLLRTSGVGMNFRGAIVGSLFTLMIVPASSPMAVAQ
ncbi:hypothetical protein ABTO59_18425, partial [Acinetobacter baumannii]